MPQPVSIKAIVDALEAIPPNSCQYLNLQTGEVIWIEEDYGRLAEDGVPEDETDNLQDWEKEFIREAEEVLADTNNQTFIELPTQWEIHEYRIMEDFCFSLEDDKTRGDLFFALKGKGAFRRFKDFVIQFGIDPDWYAFKRRRLAEMAVRWCEENELEYDDDFEDTVPPST